ncbi:ANL family adenylate-forming protein [Shewanella halifaxensis]|uniref:ANL family adenylate-forming protein n=1 Tax=Shewanella halifaxensis TaxID=271098 RepID=UPI000D5A1C7D|nr:fatty acid--CoA ligase family protein [Shewanella halifaxensis]
MALVTEQQQISYGSLLDTIDRLEQVFQQITSGAVVAVIGDYSAESIAALLALYRKRCIVAPITTKKLLEQQIKVDTLQPDFIVTIGLQVDVTANLGVTTTNPLIDRLRIKNSAGLVLFSSGSTGKPKAMLHDFERLLSGYAEQKSRNMAILVLLMFDHIGGLNTLFNALSAGMRIIIPSIREPEAVAELIEKYEVNILPASPTFLNLLLISGAIDKYNLSSLKLVTYGSEAMPGSLLVRCKQKFLSVKFLQTFGTSETGIIKTESRASDSLDIRFVDNNQSYKIIDGELWLRSEYRIEGYLNQDTSTVEQDGWFRTGDIVEEHLDGYLRIVGRLNDIINVGGEKVFPAEVESCILQLDEVDTCIVYGADNAITGKTVMANVSLAYGCDFSTVKRKIKHHCLLYLERFKVPTKINLVENLAMTDRLKRIKSMCGVNNE